MESIIRKSFPESSHAAYMYSEITFAVISLTSPSSNSTLYYLVSCIGLSFELPTAFPHYAYEEIGRA